MNAFRFFQMMSHPAPGGGSGGGCSTERMSAVGSGTGSLASLDGDYVLTSGSSSDTSGIWYNSVRGKYLWFNSGFNMWFIDPDMSATFPGMANTIIDDPGTSPGSWTNVSDTSGSYTFTYHAS